MTSTGTRADAVAHASVPSPRGYGLVAGAAMLWGTWSLFFRNAGIDARWTTPIVFTAMVLGGAPLLLRREARSRSPHSATDRTRMVLLGLFDAANAGLFFTAMDRTTVAIAVLSHYLAPVLVSLVAPHWLGTPKHRGAIGRALIATAGLLLVLQPWRMYALAPRHLVGAALGAGSAVFYATNVCLSKQLARTYTAEETLVFHAAIAALVVLPFAPWTIAPSVGGVAIVAFAGVVVGVTAAVSFVRGIAVIPAEHASVLTFLEPITAVLVGVIAFGEHLSALSLVGAVVVVGAGLRATRASP